MSKLLGKLLIKADCCPIEWEEGNRCLVKYVKNGDYFAFAIRKQFVNFRDIAFFKLGRDLCELLCEIDSGEHEWLYKFSVGYKTKIKRGVEDLKKLRNDELDYIARCFCPDYGSGESGSGRKYLLLNEVIPDDFSFDLFCVLLYRFKISKSFLKNVIIQWKRDRWGRSNNRWLEAEKRSEYIGRKKGARGISSSVDVGGVGSFGYESDEEFNARIAHNKRVAVLKGYLGWYLDACREECKRKGIRFDKKLWLSVWKVEREGKSDLT